MSTTDSIWLGLAWPKLRNLRSESINPYGTASLLARCTPTPLDPIADILYAFSF